MFLYCIIFCKQRRAKTVFSAAIILNIGLLYISLFPQLIAGPIVTCITVEKELQNRPNTINNAANGIRRFVIDLGKKVILANNMAVIIDHYLSFDIATLSTPIAWVGILSYALQIYFGFSGYSDMAISILKTSITRTCQKV